MYVGISGGKVRFSSVQTVICLNLELNFWFSSGQFLNLELNLRFRFSSGSNWFEPQVNFPSGVRT
jgi:hypothetical protein